MERSEQGRIRELERRLAEAEQALGTALGESRAFFTHGLDAVLVMDDTGRLVDANPAACEVLGRTVEQLRALTLMELVPEQERGEIAQAWTEFLREGQREGAMTIVRLGGELRDLAYRARAHILPHLHVAWNRDITERRRAEVALRQSEARFRTMLERSSDVISVHDVSGVMRYQSASVLPVLGYHPEELVGEPLMRYIHPDDQAQVGAQITRILASLEPIPPFETRFRHKDGRWRWFECVGTNLVDDPVLHGLLFNARDITDRKVAERELARNQIEREIILRSIVDGIIVTDGDGRMIYANAAAARLMRFASPDELVAADVEWIFGRIEIWAEDGRPITPGELPGARVLQGEAQAQATVRWRHRDEAVEQYLVLSAIAVQEGAAIRYVINVLHDLTARIASERAASDLAAIVDAAEDAIVGASADGTIRSWNPGATRLYGYTAAEAIGRPLHTLYRPTDHAALRQLLADVQTGRRIAPFETEQLHRSGSVVAVSLTAAPVADRRGGTAGMAVIAHDIRPRLQLEQQFRQAQKMEAIGSFAGGIAHDFNNILTVILADASFLTEEVPPGGQAAQLVTEIDDAARRATELVAQLLAFGRKQVLAPRVLDLHASVRKAERMLRRVVGEEVQLVLAPGAEPVNARVDPSQLDQILVNLVVNARDAMPRGGTITIATHVDAAGRGVLSVADTGIGMDEATRARIFEPFFTTKGVGMGTGLGLAMVYGAVTQHGGTIEVVTAPGHGARFDITLPLATSPVDQPAVPAAAPSPVGVETVLVVEDDDAVRALVCRVLEGCGYTVLAARSGEDALARLRRDARTIHLLVTDVVMPNLNGRELAAEVGRLRPGTKVLYVSGYTDDAVVRRGVSQTEIAFLAKPFTPAALAEKVRAVLDGP